MEMRYQYKEEFVEESGRTNAQACLKLYSYLEQLGPRALYADTDSGEWKPELGDYLVDLPNEVQLFPITVQLQTGLSIGSPEFFDEVFFVLISHFHHLVADKIYTHHKNLVAGQHVDKWRYIRDYHEKEGILLDYNNIKNNPGLRALAKLILNSFWGKFGQRSKL
jgi:hypothetical protein